jgi:hypothetical protein
MKTNYETVSPRSTVGDGSNFWDRGCELVDALGIFAAAIWTYAWETAKGMLKYWPRLN